MANLSTDVGQRQQLIELVYTELDTYRRMSESPDAIGIATDGWVFARTETCESASQ
jgi:hypothetical protein